LEAITATNENTLTFQRDKENKKKDCFDKFHPSTKQMILFASAVDVEDAPTKPEETCERFINASTQGVAEQEFSMQFKSMELGKVAHATGLTLNLYSGKFLYAVRNHPSNFSCFSVHEGTHLTKKNSRSTSFSSTSLKPRERGSLTRKSKQ
jgi:hypothetical protein